MSRNVNKVPLGLLLIASGVCAIAQPYTTVSDTLSPGISGQPVNGSISLTWPEFTYGAATIGASPVGGYTIPFVSGRISIPLVPTDAVSGINYQVAITIGGRTLISYWSVPTMPSGRCASRSYCTIAEVTVVPSAGPPTSLSWRSLTNPQWTGMTNSQWTSMGN